MRTTWRAGVATTGCGAQQAQRWLVGLQPCSPPWSPEISLVRVGMGEMSGRRVVHHGLGDLAEGGHQTVDQDEDQQETHRGSMLAGHGSDGQGNKACRVRRRVRARVTTPSTPSDWSSPAYIFL